MNAKLRLIASALIAFFFYAAWAYYANSLVSDDPQVLIKAALVQGSYSGLITLAFTFVLEYFHNKFGHSDICIAFLTPHWSVDSEDSPCSSRDSIDKALRDMEKLTGSNSIPGMLLVPLPAIILQSIFVVSVNLAFATPNLWLTVAPSIVFSGVYGYLYSFGLSRQHRQAQSLSQD